MLQLVIMLFLWLSNNCRHSAAVGIAIDRSHKVQCIAAEREALLQFKDGVEVDNCGLLASWGDQQPDCCQWHGIHCSNSTGRVTRLDLRGVSDRCLVGKISTSLEKLEEIEYLDLSYNDFQFQPIPSFIGSFSKLEYLNLSYTNFQGEIPEQLGNLSKLVSLDLNDENRGQYVKSLQWVFGLRLLRDINLSGVDLSEAVNWWLTVNNLPLLQALYMNDCLLSPIPPYAAKRVYLNENKTTLQVLSLADNHFLDASIFHWLFNLTRGHSHLVYLDLSGNNINGSIPDQLGNLRSLSFLDLSGNFLTGFIPSHLGDMLSLSYLDLSSNSLEGRIPSTFGKNMQSLTHLDLSFNSLEGPIPKAFGDMHSLRYLSLAANNLEGPVLDTVAHLKHLAHISLSSNHFKESESFANTRGELCNLEQLNLDNNTMTDNLSSIIQTLFGSCELASLKYLDLSMNQIRGSVPDSISKFSSLKQLYLSHNLLNDTISQSLGHLSMIEQLVLSSNLLQGTFSSSHLFNLSKLQYLDLSDNPALTVNISSDWIPPFQLEHIDLSTCKLGPKFPGWLLTQTSFTYLDISNGQISDSIPPSFLNSFSSDLTYLNVSRNMVHGMLPDGSVSLFHTSPIMDFSSNHLEGPIPSFLRKAVVLNLSNNRFSNLSPFFCPNTTLILSSLDLSNNLLQGELPDCWIYFAGLSFLHLQNNKFQGEIPASIGTLKGLEVLHLSNNSLSGEISMSLENCTSLIILDLAYNSLTGNISSTMGINLRSLGFLRLRSNKLSGGLPLSLCQLSQLQILDIAVNQITGNIPECLYNLTAMADDSVLQQGIVNAYARRFSGYNYASWLMWKRKEHSFMSSLVQVKYIDVSDNELQGEIPQGISSLKGLISLDFSKNNLTGSITPKIGQLTSLEYLDLSRNHLSGHIPTSLSNLDSLGILNLSYNSLSGKIPTSPKLQGFDPSTYMGNPQLCGDPLPKCPSDITHTATGNGDNTNKEKDEDADIFLGLYISVILGFITGFWGVCGPLLLKRSWNRAYFRFLDDLYAMVVMNIARAWRKT